MTAPLSEEARRPRLLDLFCGAGGAAMGYARAGFEVVGVDIKPQPHYPFTFVQADALTVLDGLNGYGEDWWHPALDDPFDAIHASPPCQAYSSLRHMPGAVEYPDLVGPTRDRLIVHDNLLGKPWVIENVPQAPLIAPAIVCASAFGVRLPDGARLQRHRAFESNVWLWSTQCVHLGQVLGVYGDIRRSRRSGMLRGTKASWAEAQELMGIDWMNDDELTEAIPPAYTEWVGRQLIEALHDRRPFVDVYSVVGVDIGGNVTHQGKA